jgi:hypothetical protein
VAAPGRAGRIRGLRRVFVAPLLTDTGSTTTYGTAVNIGGQAEITWGEVEDVFDLETSTGIENSDSIVKALNWSMKFGEKNLDLLDLIRGGKVYSDSPGGKDIFAFTKGSKGGYFGIFAQPTTVQGGPADYYIALAKCRYEAKGNNTLGNAWLQNDLAGRAFYTLKDGLLWGEAFLSTLTDVTASVVLTDLQGAITSGT